MAKMPPRYDQGHSWPEHGVHHIDDHAAKIDLVKKVEGLVDEFESQHRQPRQDASRPTPEDKDGGYIDGEAEMNVKRIPTQVQEVGRQALEVVRHGGLPCRT